MKFHKFKENGDSCLPQLNIVVDELLSLTLPALFVLAFSTPAQSYFIFPYLHFLSLHILYLLFRTCIFHPCTVVLDFSVLAFSYAPYFELNDIRDFVICKSSLLSFARWLIENYFDTKYCLLSMIYQNTHIMMLIMIMVVGLMVPVADLEIWSGCTGVGLQFWCAFLQVFKI